VEGAAVRIRVIVEDADERLEGSGSIEQFAGALQEMADLYVEKTVYYGDAWRQQGWMGNLARIMSKVARLRNMSWRRDPIDNGKETTEDTLLDLANLSVFGLLNRRDGNFWGTR
jgi:hypothetical protein